MPKAVEFGLRMTLSLSSCSFFFFSQIIPAESTVLPVSRKVFEDKSRSTRFEVMLSTRIIPLPAYPKPITNKWYYPYSQVYTLSPG